MKKILFKICILSLILGSMTACHTQRHYTSGKAKYEYQSGTIHKGTSKFFLGGIGQTDEINAVEICKTEENIQAVESKTSFIDGLLHTITFTIYSPREYTVYCK